MPLDQHREGRGLHPPDGQYLLVAAVLQRVRPRRVHAQQPVTDSPRKTRIEQIIVPLGVFQFLKALAYCLRRQRRNPQAQHLAFVARFLHHPPLYQLAFLPRVAAVYYHIRLFKQSFYDVKLLAHPLILLDFRFEFFGQHRQCVHLPPLPVVAVIVGRF